jgi:DNA-binding MarR family transcriptional regulator
MLYATSVAVGVAEEKSSRVMELLLNAATPLQLLVGKIVGIGAACLTQMACLVAVGIGALLLQIPLQAALFGANGGGFIQYLTSISIPFYLLFLVYFLLDFFLYATLYAGLGALVKRQDEVQSAVQVPTMLLIGGFVAIYLLPSLTTTLPKGYNTFSIKIIYSQKGFRFMDADQLLDGLFAIWRLMRRAISLHQQSTLTLEQFWLLRQLWCQGPMTIGELAAALGITPGSVTIACKRLEKDGHVTRDRQTQDERIVRVSLTPGANGILEVWLARRREVFAQFLDRLEPDEQADMMRMIERVLEVAQSSSARAEI